MIKELLEKVKDSQCLHNTGFEYYPKAEVKSLLDLLAGAEKLETDEGTILFIPIPAKPTLEEAAKKVVEWGKGRNLFVLTPSSLTEFSRLIDDLAKAMPEGQK